MSRKTEDDLLLCCLNIGTDEAKAGRLDNWSDSDWDEVIQRSVRHGVTPLLYHRFMANRIAAHIPIEVMQRLRKIYLYSARENMRLYHEVSKVLRALQDADIPVIVLKGAALAESIYHNIALRPMVDVDLLAKAEDIQRIDEALSQLGYGNMTFVPSQRRAKWIRHIRHVIYTNGVTRVEVHPRIYELPDLNPWINASPAAIASTDTLILGPEDLLLHLCLHLDSHLRVDPPRLIWWCDIAEVLKHYREELDWGYVIRIAKEHQVEGSIHRIFYMISEALDGNVPADVLSQLESDGITVSVSDVLRSGKVENQELAFLSSSLSVISRMPSIRSKISYIFGRIFPPRDRMVHYHSVTRPSRIYFCYLTRIGRLAIRAVKALYQLPSHLKNKRVL